MNPLLMNPLFMGGAGLGAGAYITDQIRKAGQRKEVKKLIG